MNERYHGEIKAFYPKRAFGFVWVAPGQGLEGDLYFDVAQYKGAPSLLEMGLPVTFTLGTNHRGTCAVEVLPDLDRRKRA